MHCALHKKTGSGFHPLRLLVSACELSRHVSAFCVT